MQFGIVLLSTVAQQQVIPYSSASDDVRAPRRRAAAEMAAAAVTIAITTATATATARATARATHDTRHNTRSDTAPATAPARPARRSGEIDERRDPARGRDRLQVCAFVGREVSHRARGLLLRARRAALNELDKRRGIADVEMCSSECACARCACGSVSLVRINANPQRAVSPA